MTYPGPALFWSIKPAQSQNWNMHFLFSFLKENSDLMGKEDIEGFA